MRHYVSCWILVSGFVSVSVAGEQSVKQGIAERMTREAIAAGAAGDMELRQTLLEQATTVAPDHAPARWAQGQIEVDGEWQPIAAVQNAACNSDRRDQYEALRAEISNAPSEHLELARWCRKHGLADEARFHWLAVLAVDANHREALAALDSVWIDGELVPRDEADEHEVSRRELRKIEREWRTRIAGWERALAAGGDEAARALAELDAEVDESAIPAFEKLSAGRRGVTSSEAARHEQLCLAFVEALGHLPSYEASESLVRLAVLAESDPLRARATEQLQTRPLHEVVPQLIAGLAGIVESRFEISRSETGRVSYTHELYAEGPASNQVTEVAKSATAPLVLELGSTDAAARRAVVRSQQRSTSQMATFQAEAARLNRMAMAVNASRAALNARITPILAQVTGQDLGGDPTAWWEYWGEHNGYESYRPTETYRTSTSYVDPIVVRAPSSCECFAAGTLVWTKTGMEPIESLTAGDLVLTMDVETGERCFRPVLRTTRRPPSKLMRLATSHYQLFATPGHPFWVEGSGWKMAKELSVGDRIASAEGTPHEVRVLASSDGEQEAFNLVVEGNNNYFVGVEGLLSHDNTQRRPELARAAMR